MQKTSLLNLPIYNTPSTDLFRINDFNTGMQNLENFAQGLVSDPQQVTIVNQEVIDARGTKNTLNDRLNEADIKANNIVQFYVHNNSTLIDAITNITSNCTISIAPGTYIDVENIPTISNKSNIKIIGYGAEIKCKVISSDATLGARFATPFTFTGCTNITIEGLKINGGFIVNQTCVTTTNHSKLLTADNCNNINVKNVYFTGGATNKVTGISGSESCVLITNSNNVKFRDCKFNDNYMEGFWIESCTNVVIDKLEAINPYTWTTLDIFKCNGVTISNSYVYVKNGTWNDSATLNAFSSNVVIENCILKGGSGLDFSDEGGIFGTSEKNILVTGTLIDAKYGFHISGDSYADNVKVDKCTINAVFGFYYYMYQNRHIKNLKILNNTINAINGFRCRMLGGTPIIEDVCIKNNTMICGTITESTTYDVTLTSYNGGSSGIVFTGTTGATSGNEIVKNIHIEDNSIYAQGSWVFTRSDVLFKIYDMHIENNKCFNHTSALTTQVDRSMYLNNIERLSMKNNKLYDCKNSNIWACKDISIIGNKTAYINTTQATRVYFLYLNTGMAIIKDNICNASVLEHVQAGTTTSANNFTSYILHDNLPATYKDITAN